MRTKNSLKNFGTGLVNTFVTTILSFVARTIFIKILGSSYLGVNGLLTNVLSMLSLVELGIGSAINFSLYKPIAEDDEEKVLLLMNFYKIAYRVIGAIVFGIGLILMCFINVIIKDAGDVQNVKLIFFIYLVNTTCSYFMTYKVTLLNAYQKAYKINTINIIFSILTTVFQCLILIITKNYIAYLLMNMVVLFVQRACVNRKITKMYPLLNKKVEGKLEKTELQPILKNVKALMFHKIGDYCINGTDNIIISSFISVGMVGIYSNYSMLIGIVNGVIVSFFNSMIASMGNLIAIESDKRKRQIFDLINFIGFWLFGFTAICFYNLLNPFIELWLGNNYVFSKGIVVVIILNYYLTGMRIPVYTVKSAAGLYNEDKFTPLIQAGVNLFVSIVLVQSLGIVGVFLGTLISSLVLPCWQRPYIVCKYALKQSSKPYFQKYVKYILVVMITALCLNLSLGVLFPNVTILNFAISTIICAIVPNVVFLGIFRKTDEFKELINIVNNILGERLKWIKKLAL